MKVSQRLNQTVLSMLSVLLFVILGMTPIMMVLIPPRSFVLMLPLPILRTITTAFVPTLKCKLSETTF